MHTGRYVSTAIPLNLGSKKDGFDRADIEIYGIDQSGASFEGRVFLNNPEATLATPLSPENGYAGSFHVYGYGIWPADVTARPAKPAGSQGIRAPITKTLIATEAVRRAAAKGNEASVTVVPVFPGNPPRDAGEAFKLEGVRIIIH